jgi:hypothetical protein
MLKLVSEFFDAKLVMCLTFPEALRRISEGKWALKFDHG